MAFNAQLKPALMFALIKNLDEQIICVSTMIIEAQESFIPASASACFNGSIGWWTRSVPNSTNIMTGMLLLGYSLNWMQGMKMTLRMAKSQNH
jgi:hypothetical protein